MDGDPTTTPSLKQARIFFWSLALALGALYAWASRHGMEPDAIPYLDMGDAFWKGEWRQAINGRWSPLYPVLLGLVLRVFHPSPYWEFTAVHLVGFGIYVGALASFDFFLRASFRYHRQRVRQSDTALDILPEWLWFTLGYSLFIWSSVRLILIVFRIRTNVVADQGVLPDMLAAAFMYLAAGLLYKILLERNRTRPLALLGGVLGLAYLERSHVLILVLPFLGIPLALGSGHRRSVTSLIPALLIFLTISLPYIMVLSMAKGRPTLGDTAWLNYVVLVNRVPMVHWQGGAPGRGAPKHPTRRIFDRPAVYEFGTPVAGTYPPWYDPAYWYDGIVPRIDAQAQLSALLRNMRRIGTVLYEQNAPLLVAALALILFAHLSDPQYSLLASLRDSWSLLLLSGAGFAAFVWIHVEPRYVAPFIVLLWMGIFSIVRVANTPGNMRALASVVVASVLLLLASVGGQTLSEVRDIIRGRSSGMSAKGHVQWQVADGIQHIGVRPGDKVAILGTGFWAYWARLARVKIVAEIADESVPEFWSMSLPERANVIDALSKTSARVIVTQEIPSDAGNGWERIGTTEYYAYPLKR